MPTTPKSTGADSAGSASLAFSLYAPYYDAEHDANPIARWTRRRSLEELHRAFRTGDHLLELGCGTGAEAIALARSGVRVVATDAAPAMVGVLRAKLAPGGPAHDVAGLVETNVMPAGRTAGMLRTHGEGAFDGAYSSFGPLNCEPALTPVLKALHRLVRPGGVVVMSLINRYCLWETVWYLATRDPQRAFRRWRGMGEATVRGEWQDLRVPVYYWSVAQVERAASKWFRVEQRMALTWLLPPQYLDGLVRRAPRLFGRLARIERATAGTWPFNRLGDHSLLVLVRK